MCSPASGNGSRWVSRHALSVPCREGHAAALTAFKSRCAEAVAAIPPVDTVVPSSVPAATGTTILTIWERCKLDRHIKDIMIDAEERVKEAAMFDMDEDDPVEYVFDPVEGFAQIARLANGFKKSYTMTKQEMEALVLKHDSELKEQHKEIQLQRTVIHNQAYDIKELKSELDEMREKIRQLEEEMAKLTAKPA